MLSVQISENKKACNGRVPHQVVNLCLFLKYFLTWTPREQSGPFALPYLGKMTLLSCKQKLFVDNFISWISLWESLSFEAGRYSWETKWMSVFFRRKEWLPWATKTEKDGRWRKGSRSEVVRAHSIFSVYKQVLVQE